MLVKRLVAVTPVVDAVVSTVCPDTVSAVADAFCSEVFPVAVKRVAVVEASVDCPATVIPFRKVLRPAND